MDAASLTRSEAEERSRLLAVTRYDLDVDLTGLLEGDTFRAVSTITFTCSEPGASTFVDCAAEIERAELNGRPLDPASARDGRLPLTDLAADNVLVVASAQSDTASSSGILRTVDPSDGLVYVWTSFEPDEARRMWACFDQPDLKAPHRFVVDAPDTWTVTSNTGPEIGLGGRRRRPHLDLPGHPDALDVRRGRQRRPVPRGASPARRVRPRLLLPPVAGRGARARPRRPGDRHPAGARVLRRAVRRAVPAAALRPGVRPRPRRRDGELGVRHLRRRPALAHPAQPRAARAARGVRAPRDGAHVVRRPGDHALVGRPVAQRGLRVVGLQLGAVARHRVRRPVGGVPRALQAGRLRHGHGPGPAPDPRRRAGRRPRQRQLRLDHLRQGPERAPPADGLHRRGGVRGRAAGLLPRPRLGQHRPRRPDVGVRRGRRHGPDRLDRCLARPVRHRHAAARRRRDPRRVARRRPAAPPPADRRQLRRLRSRRWCRSRRPTYASTTW